MGKDHDLIVQWTVDEVNRNRSQFILEDANIMAQFYLDHQRHLSKWLRILSETMLRESVLSPAERSEGAVEICGALSRSLHRNDRPGSEFREDDACCLEDPEWVVYEIERPSVVNKRHKKFADLVVTGMAWGFQLTDSGEARPWVKAITNPQRPIWVFEIKPEMDDLGGTIRQMCFYKEDYPGATMVCVSPDRKHADHFHAKGFSYWTCPSPREYAGDAYHDWAEREADQEGPGSGPHNVVPLRG